MHLFDPSNLEKIPSQARDLDDVIRFISVYRKGLVTASSHPDLGTLFEREGEVIFGFLLSRCGSRMLAEDLTTETFLSAGKRFAEGRAGEVNQGWLFTVAHRRLIDHWRKVGAERRRSERLIIELHRRPAPGDDPETNVDEALTSLSERYRAALTLRYLDDFSVSEVADALELTYKATESLLSRARAAFVTAYENRAS